MGTTTYGVPEDATVFDVVEAAQNSGVNSLNIQLLSNFLILNEDEFTSADYGAFATTCYMMKEAIIDDHVAALFPGKTAGSLTEEERYILYRSLNQDEKDAISAALINLGNAHRILVSFDTDAEGYLVIYGSMRHRSLLLFSGAPYNTINIHFQTSYGTEPQIITRNYEGVDGYILTEEDLPVLYQENYIFMGWTIDNAQKEIIQPGQITYANDLFLYAVWKKIPRGIKFLAGKYLANKALNFAPGSIYYDSTTNELWFDDPSNKNNQRQKIIDTNTFIYEIMDSTFFPYVGSESSSELGIGILGLMRLGNNTPNISATNTSVFAEGIIGDMIFGN